MADLTYFHFSKRTFMLDFCLLGLSDWNNYVFILLYLAVRQIVKIAFSNLPCQKDN